MSYGSFYFFIIMKYILTIIQIYNYVYVRVFWIGTDISGTDVFIIGESMIQFNNYITESKGIS